MPPQARQRRGGEESFTNGARRRVRKNGRAPKASSHRDRRGCGRVRSGRLLLGQLNNGNVRAGGRQFHDIRRRGRQCFRGSVHVVSVDVGCGVHGGGVHGGGVHGGGVDSSRRGGLDILRGHR